VDKGVRSSSLGNPDAVWRATVERLGGRIGPADVADLIRPLRPLALTPTELRLEAPNRLVMVCVNDNYVDAIRDTVAELIGPRQIVMQVSSREQGELFPNAVPRTLDKKALAAKASLNARYTFETFVVGASNQFAHAACRAVAGQPGDHYNPLFVYGGVGLGKTHLVNAIGHHVLGKRPDAGVAYLSSDTFMTELIASLRKDRMEEFKKRFRHVDLLILDDVQLLSGRERTQEEFFHTFNSLHEKHRQIVLTSDKVPKDIPDLEERLRNRFEWGLIADIQPPDVETRMAIVERKAELDGIPLGRDVAQYLAEHFAANVRELEGSLTRLGAHASLHRTAITVEYAREVLETLRAEKAATTITFDAITAAVCEHFALKQSDLRSRRRSRHIAGPRQVAMYLCRRLLGTSLPRIGEMFDRDHSTVFHAVEATEKRLKDDDAFQAAVDRLEQRIRHHQTS
jgi:chromosomal replication initiator protein